MKEVIVNLIKKSLKKKSIDISEEKIAKTIEIPPSSEMGDYALPCFFLAEIMEEEPHEIAIELRELMGNPPGGMEDIQTRGPYINFFLDRKTLGVNLIKEINSKKDNFGKSKRAGKKTMIEFPSPNTNKPLHLGHLRNMAIGESLSRIFEFNGERVIRANLNNDRGIHICKSMAAYKLYGKGKNPKSEKKKSDHFVGDYYVMFNKKEKENQKLELESHRMLQKWEAGDKETLKLWKKMNKWALDGFEKTYKKFGIKHSVEFFESKIYEKGKEIILEGLKKGIFKKKKDGAIAINLKKEKLGEKILLRLDGTSVYITQDIYLAKLKQEKYKLDKSIYVVANEQKYHFDVLFTLLEKLGFKSEGLKHLSYGMVNLPDGKMKSREGTVVDADDLIEKVQDLIKKELESRYKLTPKQSEERSLTIALAAIKYLLLKIDIKKDMVFNPKESINFEGDTGSYILYSYARASSILRKLKNKKSNSPLESLEEKEIALIKKLSDFENITLNAYKNTNPSLIANYSYQLAQIFNEFYHSCPVLNSDKESFRIELVKAFRQVLKNSLYLIGIDTLEEM